MMNHKFTIFLAISLMILSSCQEPSSVIIDGGELGIKSESKFLEKANQDQLIYYKEYDLDQNLIFAEYYSENGEKRRSSEYQYNADRVSEDRVDFESQENNNFDYVLKEDGRIDEIIERNQNGETISVTTYTYDERGNIIQKRKCYANGNCVDIENRQFNYSSDGQLESIYTKDNETGNMVISDSLVYTADRGFDIIKFDKEGNPKSIKQLFYNNLGLPSAEVLKNSTGEVIKRYKFQYTFF